MTASLIGPVIAIPPHTSMLLIANFINSQQILKRSTMQTDKEKQIPSKRILALCMRREYPCSIGRPDVTIID